VPESSMPLFPTDDGWPYADGVREWASDDGVDLDVLELLCSRHVYDSLSVREHEALFRHFGLGHEKPLTMKQLGPALGCSHADAAALVGSAVDKVRRHLTA
jgi:DNA-directed RNA polymerase sigma subunit (sigma70/sigma32)